MSDALAKARLYMQDVEDAKSLSRAESRIRAERYTMLSIAESLSRLADRLAPDNPPMSAKEATGERD